MSSIFKNKARSQIRLHRNKTLSLFGNMKTIYIFKKILLYIECLLERKKNQKKQQNRHQLMTKKRRHIDKDHTLITYFCQQPFSTEILNRKRISPLSSFHSIVWHFFSYLLSFFLSFYFFIPSLPPFLFSVFLLLKLSVDRFALHLPWYLFPFAHLPPHKQCTFHFFVIRFNSLFSLNFKISYFVFSISII